MIINVLENDGIEFFFVNEVGVIMCFFFKGDIGMVFVNVFNYFRDIRCLRKIFDEIFIWIFVGYIMFIKCFIFL